METKNATPLTPSVHERNSILKCKQHTPHDIKWLKRLDNRTNYTSENGINQNRWCTVIVWRFSNVTPYIIIVYVYYSCHLGSRIVYCLGLKTLFRACTRGVSGVTFNWEKGSFIYLSSPLMNSFNKTAADFLPCKGMVPKVFLFSDYCTTLLLK